MDDFSGLRRNMVDCQLRTYDITDRAVLAAADSVPREAFVPENFAHLAYLDQSIALPGTGRRRGFARRGTAGPRIVRCDSGQRCLRDAAGIAFSLATH